jgi:sugar/nucleoside kinase (ribokinase family)
VKFEATANELDVIKALWTFLPEITVILITLGENGAIASIKRKDDEDILRTDAWRANVVDAVGAGDTFVGYFLSRLLSEHAEKRFNSEVIQDAMNIACCAGALCCETKGAMSSIPRIEDIYTRMSRQ